MNTEQTSKNIFMYNCLTFQDLNRKKTKTKKNNKTKQKLGCDSKYSKVLRV